MNVLLIQGGWSNEREVSLSSARQIAKALQELGHTITYFDPMLDLPRLNSLAAQHDFAFIALHGSPGEDGLFQAILDQVGCPYQGSDAAGSQLAINKAMAKIFFEQAGLPTPRWELLTQQPEPGWMPDLRFPLFIKANTGGSSLNMERVTTAAELPAALDRLFSVGSTYLVEEAVTGMELTCGVLGFLKNNTETPEALAPILIKPKLAKGLFDYKSKYAKGGAEELCPAPIAPELTQKIQDIALKAHDILGLRGYSRSDFILTAQGQPMLLETNTLPGMTETSLLPQEAAVHGLSFTDLVERLITLGLAKAKSK